MTTVNPDNLTRSAPAPPVPPDCDLRDFPDMFLGVAKLRDSSFAARTTGDEFRAALLLWSAAWHQVPAASLPDDDVELAILAGYGREVGAWRLVKAGALTKFFKCSDGRLYHPEVAARAAKAWEGKLKHRWEKECGRIRKHNKRHKANVPEPSFDEWKADAARRAHSLQNEAPEDECSMSAGNRPLSEVQGETALRTRGENPPENALKGEGEGEEERTNASHSAPAVAAAVKRLSARDQLFAEGVPLIRDATGKSRDAAASMLGRLVKEARDDCNLVLAVLKEAADYRPVEFMSWSIGMIKTRLNPTGKLSHWAEQNRQVDELFGDMEVENVG